MAKVTPGFKLYLYQLLSRELGFGKQTLLPQVEEALAADDIIPADLECETVQELAEACSDFLKVRVFKKGRVYVTVLRNEEWDQMLAAPIEKPAPKKGASGGGPKSWKKKKSAKKSLKPVKPGKQRRDRETAEALAAAERAAAEEEARREAERAAAEAQAATEREAAEEAERATPQEEEAPTLEPTVAEPAAEAEAEAPEVPEATLQKATVRTLAEILAEARTQEETPTSATEAESTPMPVPEAVPTPAPEVEQTPTPEPAPEPELAPEPEATPSPEPEAPAAPEPSPISLTITYDPYEDMERELERQRMEEQAAPKPARPQTPPPAAAPAASHGIPLTGLPQSIADEVSCKDALLRVLYHLLPYEVDPMAVLDEDWRVARSTGDLSGTRNRVGFPLRYQHEDGTPITVTLRKTARNISGRQWNLVLVDGDDGTGSSHEAVGFEGLPAADEGAWRDLSSMSVNLSLSPVRELAQRMVIGTWDAFLGALCAMAAPERWNYPGEGVGHASRYGILREYVASTYHRARCQERVAHSSDDAFAAFNTGLLTTFGDDIYACLTARKGDIPWQFAGFATAGSGELGARLAGTISPLPEPPSYLTSLESVTPDHDRMVIIDLESILTSQLGRMPRAFLLERLEDNDEARTILHHEGALSADDLVRLARAIKADACAYRRLRRALDDAVERAMSATRVSYRLAAPVYDPTENRTKLLVPLCLVEDGRADCALVLDLQPSGAYRAAALLSLPRAYACARVVSKEQPSWLDARKVLR